MVPETRLQAPSHGVLVGRNILRLREAAKLTQEHVAEAAGVSWRYLQELEAGKGTNPSLTVLCGLKSGARLLVGRFAGRDAVKEAAG